MTESTGLTGLLIAKVDWGCCRRGVVRPRPSIPPPFSLLSSPPLLLLSFPFRFRPLLLSSPFSFLFPFRLRSCFLRSHFVPVSFYLPCGHGRCFPSVFRSIRSSPPIVVQPSSPFYPRVLLPHSPRSPPHFYSHLPPLVVVVGECRWRIRMRIRMRVRVACALRSTHGAHLRPPTSLFCSVRRSAIVSPGCVCDVVLSLLVG